MAIEHHAYTDISNILHGLVINRKHSLNRLELEFKRLMDFHTTNAKRLYDLENLPRRLIAGEKKELDDLKKDREFSSTYREKQIELLSTLIADMKEIIETLNEGLILFSSQERDNPKESLLKFLSDIDSLVPLDLDKYYQLVEKAGASQRRTLLNKEIKRINEISSGQLDNDPETLEGIKISVIEGFFDHIRFYTQSKTGGSPFGYTFYDRDRDRTSNNNYLNRTIKKLLVKNGVAEALEIDFGAEYVKSRNESTGSIESHYEYEYEYEELFNNSTDSDEPLSTETDKESSSEYEMETDTESPSEYEPVFFETPPVPDPSSDTYISVRTATQAADTPAPSAEELRLKRARAASNASVDTAFYDPPPLPLHSHPTLRKTKPVMNEVSSNMLAGRIPLGISKTNKGRGFFSRYRSQNELSVPEYINSLQLLMILEAKNPEKLSGITLNKASCKALKNALGEINLTRNILEYEYIKLRYHKNRLYIDDYGSLDPSMPNGQLLNKDKCDAHVKLLEGEVSVYSDTERFKGISLEEADRIIRKVPSSPSPRP
jgi:hypothetical protein